MTVEERAHIVVRIAAVLFPQASDEELEDRALGFMSWSDEQLLGQLMIAAALVGKEERAAFMQLPPRTRFERDPVV